MWHVSWLISLHAAASCSRRSAGDSTRLGSSSDSKAGLAEDLVCLGWPHQRKEPVGVGQPSEAEDAVPDLRRAVHKVPVRPGVEVGHRQADDGEAGRRAIRLQVLQHSRGVQLELPITSSAAAAAEPRRRGRLAGAIQYGPERRGRQGLDVALEERGGVAPQGRKVRRALGGGLERADRQQEECRPRCGRPVLLHPAGERLPRLAVRAEPVIVPELRQRAERILLRVLNAHAGPRIAAGGLARGQLRGVTDGRRALRWRAAAEWPVLALLVAALRHPAARPEGTHTRQPARVLYTKIVFIAVYFYGTRVPGI